MKYSILIGLILIVALLNSCAIGLGGHKIDNGFFSNYDDKVHVDAELSKPVSNKIEGAISVNFAHLLKGGGTLSTTAGEVSKIRIRFADTRLAARFQLFNYKHFNPYFGTGAGWFRLLSNVTGVGRKVSSGFYYDIYEVKEETNTLASGFFPFIEAGIVVPISTKYSIRFSGRKDYSKDDGEIDMSGSHYLISVIFWRGTF